MKRLSLWLVGLVVGSSFGWVRAADPVPAMAVPAVQSVTPVVSTEFCGACCSMEGQSCGCREDCDRGGIVAGASLLWLQPQFNNNPAFTVSRTSPTGPGGTSRTVTERTDIAHHMDVSPQIWLGYVTESGLGARVRWWYFSQATDQGIAVNPGSATTLTRLESAAPLGFPSFVDNDGRPASIYVTSKLGLQVWDAEALNSVQTGNWDLLLAGGVRYAQINQHYNAMTSGDSGGGTGPVMSSVLSGHAFNGIGPMLALEARRALGDSGVSLYGSARGAILFGSQKQQARDVFVDGSGLYVDDSSDRHSSIIPVGELELGLEFSRTLSSSRAFGQVALVGQEWWSAGSASRAANTNSFGVPTTGGTVVSSDLGFLGVAFRLGLNY